MWNIREVKTNKQIEEILKDNKSLGEFLKTNESFLRSIAAKNLKFIKPFDDVSIDDLIQDATLMLIHSLEKFDDIKNASLFTFASLVIYNSFLYEYTVRRKPYKEKSTECMLIMNNRMHPEYDEREYYIPNDVITNEMAWVELEDNMLNKIVLNSVIDKLPLEHKEICQLRLMGLELEEIAKEMKMKMSKLKTIYFRYFTSEFQECRNLL